MGKKSQWLNTTFVRNELEKPCIKLQYCPYGGLVEEFPIQEERTKLSCHIKNGAIITFGHNCPVHYLAELVQ